MSDDGGVNVDLIPDDKPTLHYLDSLVRKMNRIGAEMEALMSGRDDREAGVTERERQAREKAETEARDREDAQTRVIVTREQAMRRIADLEDERTVYRNTLENTSNALRVISDVDVIPFVARLAGQAGVIRRVLDRHEEKLDE